MIAYVNGRYLPLRDASISVEDRGLHFSDGVYEVVAFYNGKFLDGDRHLDRLQRSLKELSIPMPMSRRALELVIDELVARNRVKDGTMYLQVTRGIAKRDHGFPKAKVRPSLMLNLTGPKWPKPEEIEKGAAVVTTPDLRWARRDIKTVSLLANVLAKQEAAKHGVREAWMVEDGGMVTEGSSSNSWIVDAKGKIRTYPDSRDILGGVTREVTLELIRKAKLPLELKPFTVKEAYAAKEAFLTSTTANVLPVTRVDGKKIGSGMPGPVAKKLMELFSAHMYRQVGK